MGERSRSAGRNARSKRSLDYARLRGIRALADPEPAVRWRACLALELTRDRRAVQALEDLKARESDDRVRRFAERALDQIRTAP